jgi:hypothetical protein
MLCQSVDGYNQMFPIVRTAAKLGRSSVGAFDFPGTKTSNRDHQDTQRKLCGKFDTIAIG